MLVNKIKIVIFILLLIGTLIGCFYWGNKNITLGEKINAEYRMVNFDNIVSGKIEAWRYRGLNNYSSSWQVGKEQLVTFPWAENWAYSKRHLSLFCKKMILSSSLKIQIHYIFIEIMSSFILY